MSDLEHAIKGELVPALASHDRAKHLESLIVEAVAEERRQWVMIAAGLYHFKEEQAWIALGYNTFTDWLNNPELDVGPRHHMRLIEIYRVFCIEQGVRPELLGRAEQTKVQEVLPAVRRRQITPEEALADATMMSRSDLRKAYPAGGIEDRKLDPTKEVQIVRCPTCNQRTTADQLSASGGTGA